MAKLNNTLPTPTSIQDVPRILKKWQTQLNPLLSQVKTPHAPYNFQATRARGGIQLSWKTIAGTDADGYQIQRSDDGNFSNPTIFTIAGANQGTFLDSLGGTAGGTGPITKFYRIRATNGTQANPQSVFGVLSGTITTSSIDPTDTVTPATTVFDNSVTDKYQSTAGKGRIIVGRKVSVD